MRRLVQNGLAPLPLVTKIWPTLQELCTCCFCKHLLCWLACERSWQIRLACPLLCMNCCVCTQNLDSSFCIGPSTMGQVNVLWIEPRKSPLHVNILFAMGDMNYVSIHTVLSCVGSSRSVDMCHAGMLDPAVVPHHQLEPSFPSRVQASSMPGAFLEPHVLSKSSSYSAVHLGMGGRQAASSAVARRPPRHLDSKAKLI